jgi:hypothetical protein
MGLVGRRSMHRGFLATVAVFVALASAGCAGSSATPAIIYITPAPRTLGPGETPTPGPPPPAITNTLVSPTAPDSRWTAIFKMPVIGATTAKKMNDAITARVSAYISAFTSSSLPAVESGGQPSTLEGNYTIALDSATLVSLRFSILTQVAGAAPVGEAGSINFTVATGATIGLGDLFTDPAAALPIITTKAKDSLSRQLGSGLTWPAGSVEMSFFEGAWAFTKDGLEFTWSQGAIASANAGPPSAVVAWADLKSVIKADGPAGEFIR